MTQGHGIGRLAPNVIRSCLGQDRGITTRRISSTAHVTCSDFDRLPSGKRRRTTR